MIAVISPAKTLDYQSPLPDLAPTAPHFVEEAQTLLGELLSAGFVLDRLVESRPDETLRESDPDAYACRVALVAVLAKRPMSCDVRFFSRAASCREPS